MNTRLFVAVLLMAGSALAQVRTTITTPGPVMPPRPLSTPAPDKLQCPQGTRQVGGPGSRFEGTGCAKANGAFDGPYVVYWPGSGARQAIGQYADGLRTGKWVYFDEKGVKLYDYEFKADDYDGLHVEYWPNGQKKLEETWVRGLRQGAQRTFDPAGRLTAEVQYAAGRAVTQ